MLMAFASPGDDLTAIGTFSNPVNGKTLDCQSFGPKVFENSNHSLTIYKPYTVDEITSKVQIIGGICPSKQHRKERCNGYLETTGRIFWRYYV